MKPSLNQVTLSVTNIERSVAFYQGLGLELIVLSPHYARFIAPGNEATFSLHLAEKVVAGAVTVYFESADLDHWVAALQKEGYSFTFEAVMQHWLWYEAGLVDPDGHPLLLYQAGENRLNPPWKIGKEKDE